MQKLALLILILGFIGCKSNLAKTSEEIKALESKLAEQPSQEILAELLELYQKMAASTTGEEHLDYLWKAGETARASKNFVVAERIFKDLYENHSQSDLASKALFLHAFMSDEDQKDFDKARLLYQEFLEKYPESDFSDDAQFLLDNLGKSDEEILELLSKSNPDNVNQ